MGIRGVMLEVLGRMACDKRGIDADELSAITGLYAWEIIAMHEIDMLRKEREATQRLEYTA